MNNTELISYVSLAVIVVSLFFIGTELTGHLVTDNETGLVNVTIQQSAALNFTTALLDFGSGSVNGSVAILNSSGAGSVSGGTWAVQPGELILNNTGNIPVKLNLSANKSAQDYIGGSGAAFEAYVTPLGSSCAGAGALVGSWQHINTTWQVVCSSFGYDTGNDSIEIDFRLTIPNNAEGAKTVGIVAVGEY